MYRKIKGFTLIEMLIVLTIFFVLLSVVLGIYSQLIRTKYTIQAKQTLIQSSYYMFEKLNLELKNFTVDYEEYFNRKMVGCDWSAYWDNFKRNVNSGNNDWHCDNFTYFGNRNSIALATETENILYYCSSQSWYSTPELVIESDSIQAGTWCFSGSLISNSWYQQSFGQYAQQFWDYKDDIWKWVGVRLDDDDEDVWRWPVSIADTNNIKELYLISQDWTKRIMFRRKMIESGDWNRDWVTWSDDSEIWYNLQMLKLRWFDAWSNHDFNISNSSWVYDGRVDTRACDYAWWFICNGSGVWSVYSGFNLPADKDDGWVSVFEKNLTISDFNIIISPNKNPNFARNETGNQINPYITLTITSKLYWQIRYKKLWFWSLDDFQLSLQTTFNTKNFYWK